MAITGASGFIGKHLANIFVENGWRTRLLARRPDALDAGIRSRCEIIAGDLNDPHALRQLTDGVSHVVHAAGLVSALDPVDFERVNVLGTKNLLKAAQTTAEPPFFLHFSSLAARQPTVSAYAESKNRSEQQVRWHLGDRSAIIRPPAVYGPGDRGTLPLFQQMQKGFLITPSPDQCRFSLIFGPDLARLAEKICLSAEPIERPLEPDDGRISGYNWPELVELASAGLGRKIRRVALPRIAYAGIAGAARLAALFGNQPALLSQEKVAELFTENWVCDRQAGDPAVSAATQVVDGFRETLNWYLTQGWLNQGSLSFPSARNISRFRF